MWQPRVDSSRKQLFLAWTARTYVCVIVIHFASLNPPHLSSGAPNVGTLVVEGTAPCQFLVQIQTENVADFATFETLCHTLLSV